MNNNKSANEQLIGVHESILIDTIFANMSYLEPRKILILNSLIQKEVNNYLANNTLNGKYSVEENIDYINSQILKDNPNLVEARNLLIDTYETYYENKNVFFKDLTNSQPIKMAIQDFNILIKEQIATNILKNEDEHNESFKLKTHNYLSNLPQTTLNKIISSDEDKKISYSLMTDIYNKFRPVSYKEQDITYKTDSHIEINAINDKGWFDFGKSDQENKKECSFLIGYIQGEIPKKLYISFRGTESNATTMLDYGLNDYPNMERHFNRMQPLLDKLIQQEIAKNNGELHISFVGHSLGAAQAEIAMSKYKDTEKVKYTATLIANPGGIHAASNVISKLDKIDQKLNENIKKLNDKEKNEFDNACKVTSFFAKNFIKLMKAVNYLGKGIDYSAKVWVGVGTICCGSLFNLGKAALKSRDDERLGIFATKIKKSFDMVTKNKFMQYSGLDGYIDGSKYLAKKVSNIIEPVGLKFIDKAHDFLIGKPIEDDRITSIRHDQDIVPKVGSLLTNHKKNNRLIIKASKIIKEQLNEVAKTVGTVYHDMNGYIADVQKGRILAEDGMKITNDKIYKLRDKYLSNNSSHRLQI